MNNQELIAFLNTLDLSVYKHASNIIAKYNAKNHSISQSNALPLIANEYYKFITQNNVLVGYTDEIIIKRTEILNNYYNFINSNNFDNVFTSQGKFRSTILEEFMYILFKDLIAELRNEMNDADEKFKLGSKKAYTNLFFSGANLKDFITSPQIGIHQKDQDFAIYRPISIKIGDSKPINTNLPIIAIENKTYIDKTMLEGSIATAEKIKSGNPYSLFIIVTENYDVDLKVDPIYSKIDQIYVLRKSKKAKNQPMLPIYSDVLVDLVSEVRTHLTRNWSDVSSKMTNTGKIL